MSHLGTCIAARGSARASAAACLGGNMAKRVHFNATACSSKEKLDEDGSMWRPRRRKCAGRSQQVVWPCCATASVPNTAKHRGGAFRAARSPHAIPFRTPAPVLPCTTKTIREGTAPVWGAACARHARDSSDTRARLPRTPAAEYTRPAVRRARSDPWWPAAPRRPPALGRAPTARSSVSASVASRALA
ncbi:hypothetical protein PsYK624_154950 [Phanerochaete sordida]|uniref:Uncharacterized protein n=1 Tax=Phanerochaete sordida TaxID=48140 RepID=A0A9P3GPD8_9APHY|nr:hypothetical protein PsYK624_154950 [Phanerochaete sordida]